MPAIDRTRKYVRQLFAELDPETESICETVLIRDGAYCGHRFSGERLSAVWFVEEDELKVYDENRKLLRAETFGTQEYRKAA